MSKSAPKFPFKFFQTYPPQIVVEFVAYVGLMKLAIFAVAPLLSPVMLVELPQSPDTYLIKPFVYIMPFAPLSAVTGSLPLTSKFPTIEVKSPRIKFE